MTRSFTRGAAVAALAVATGTGPAVAQDVSLTLGGDLTSQSVSLIAVITLLSLVPGIAVTVTCFPFLVTVLSILRQAIGMQQSPPNMLIVTLALFLTWFIMDPVLTEAWVTAVEPLLEGRIDLPSALDAGVAPFRTFMSARIDPDTLTGLAALRPMVAAGTETPMSLLMPAFLLSELARAFEIGFLIYLPFLIIDLVVSAILMSMGMMMVPPAVVSLPFKLAFFVVADGWTLISGALVRSYF